MAWALVLEGVPAASFGSAVAFVAAAFAGVPPLSPMPLGSGAAALVLSWAALRRFAGRPERFPMRYFEEPAFQPEQAESPPAEARLTMVPAVEMDELLLEQVHVAADPAARVVRLFQASEVPTAGELRERIEQHLGRTPRPALPDATEELHAALAALRRSLR